MKKNIGTLEKYIRIAVGLALISMVFILDTPVKWFGLIGIVALTTAFLNYCPLYTIFKFSTYKEVRKK